jgi:uncharacterized membrane protein
MSVFLTILAAGLLAAVTPAMASDGAPAPAAPEQPKIARGLLLLHEGRVFMAPCRDRNYLNVEDVSDGGAVLSALKDFGLASGRNLYVELLAVQEGGMLRVSSLNFAHTTARCLGETSNEEDWRALGLRSEWAAAAGAGVLLVERVDAPELRTAYAGVKNDGVQHRIEAKEVTLSFTPGLCRLADGNTITGWHAMLTPGAGAVLEGCGWER